MRAKIDSYVQRKYKSLEDRSDKAEGGSAEAVNSFENDFVPADNSLLSYLGDKISMPEDFENNYETWLDEEVFSNKINWDLLLTASQNRTIVLF